MTDKNESADQSANSSQRTQGHWVLATMGKRVLRPGGIELTRRLIAKAAPSASDRIIEFGPGVGRTAEILLASSPRSYRGVDPNPQGREQLSGIIAGHPDAEIVVADAQNTGLSDGEADLVVGEAMLTMQSDDVKRTIISEAARLLVPGGRYAIHELGFTPDDCPQEVMTEVAHALSRTIKVGARPLTKAAWSDLLSDSGFIVEWVDTNPMRLLEPSRLIADEGLLGALRFMRNVRRNPEARQRIMAMRKVFRANAKHLCAVAIVARKA